MPATTREIQTVMHAPGGSQAIKNMLLTRDFPKGDDFAWGALKKSCATEVRDLLLTVKGARPEWLKATGYWIR